MLTTTSYFPWVAAVITLIIPVNAANSHELTVYTFTDSANKEVREHKALPGVLVILPGHSPKMTNEKGEAVIENVISSNSGKDYEISLYRTGCGKQKHLYTMPDSDARIGIRMRCEKRSISNSPQAPGIPGKARASQ